MGLSGQSRPSPELTQQPTLPLALDPGLRVLQLAEDLRAELEGQQSLEDQKCLRKQVSSDTVHTLLEWLERVEVSTFKTETSA